MVYLRARYYSPNEGRFLSRDIWGGNDLIPTSYNRFHYAYSNPLRYFDPSGMITVQQADEANDIVEKLHTKYNIQIEKDWGYRETLLYLIPEPISVGCEWVEGNWRSLRELRLVMQTVTRIAEKLGGESQFKSAMNTIRITRFKGKGVGYEPPMSLPAPLADVWGDLRIPDTFFDQSDNWDRYILAHEMGHRWDFEANFALSKGLMNALDTWVCDISGNNCRWYPYAKHLDPITLDIIWEPPAGVYSGCTGEPPFTKSCPEPYALTYGFSGVQPWEGLSRYYVILPGIEDWAESFANFIYPAYYPSIGRSGLVPGGVRKNYVKKQIDLLQ
jgi:hypothetical protein